MACRAVCPVPCLIENRARLPLRKLAHCASRPRLRRGSCRAFPDRCVEIAQEKPCFGSGKLKKLQRVGMGYAMSDTQFYESANVLVRFNRVRAEEHTKVLKTC